MSHLRRHVHRSLALGVGAGITMMVAGAFVPLVTGRAIDSLVTSSGPGSPVSWCLALLALIALGAGAGIVEERAAVATRLDASYRAMTWVNARAAELGSAFRARADHGDVVTIGTGDAEPIGAALAALSRGAGGVAAVGVVGTVMLLAAWPVGVVVLIGTALIIKVTPIVLKPYRARQKTVRERQSDLTGVAMDITGGLRVIKGLGAGSHFSDRYRAGSTAVRRSATEAARSEGFVAASRILLTGLLGAVVVWLSARLALDGKLTIGQMIAFYGYAAFLRTPIRRVLETGESWAKGGVSAERVAGFLSLTGSLSPTGDGAGGPRVPAGSFTVVAGTGDVDWIPLAEAFAARAPERTLLVRHDDYLFSGTVREAVDPHVRADDGELAAAMVAAGFDDVVRALAAGLDSELRSGAAGLSGGERQRLRLFRSLVADPEVLVLIEPTSALDATTETQVIRRLRDYRAGRTTVVFGNSPLMLHESDHVCWVADGVVVAEGRHEDLLRSVPDYRTLVARREALA